MFNVYLSEAIERRASAAFLPFAMCILYCALTQLFYKVFLAIRQ